MATFTGQPDGQQDEGYSEDPFGNQVSKPKTAMNAEGAAVWLASLGVDERIRRIFLPQTSCGCMLIYLRCCDGHYEHIADIGSIRYRQ
jgi:hypothetical protein